MSRQAPIIAGAGLIALDVLLAPNDERLRTFAGGTCGNVLAIMAYLGWKSSPFATLGTDAAAERIIKDFKKFGVSSAYLRREHNVHTPVIVEYLQHDGLGNSRHRFAMTCPECGQEFPRPKVAAPHVTDMGATRPNMFFMDRLSASILKLANAAADSGAFIVYEPSVRSDETRWEEALDLANMVKYSEDRFDSAQLEGFFASRNRSTWEVQTLGKNGLRFRFWEPKKKTPKWTISSPVPALHVIDTCGAGDWCSAGIIDSLGRSAANKHIDADTMQRAVKNGQALASWSIAYEGARGGMYAVSSDIARRTAAELLAGTALHTASRLRTTEHSSSGKKTAVIDVCSIGACSDR